MNKASLRRACVGQASGLGGVKKKRNSK